MVESYWSEKKAPPHSLVFTREGQREELWSGQPVQYLNNMSHGQNLSLTSGESEFVAQYLFEIPASVHTAVTSERFYIISYFV
jgi:hypothetical protein